MSAGELRRLACDVPTVDDHDKVELTIRDALISYWSLRWFVIGHRVAVCRSPALAGPSCQQAPATVALARHSRWSFGV